MNKTIYLLAVPIAIFLLFGCSNSKHTDSVMPDTSQAIMELPSQDTNSSNADLMGQWEMIVDLDNLTLTLEPTRIPEVHYNVTGLLPAPGIVINSFDPVTRILDVDVTITNPYPIDVYDVRLILFTNDNGLSLALDDGWTGLFDIPGGLIINPFIAFAKFLPNRIFNATAIHTEKFYIYLPNPSGPINFAITASFPANCDEPYAITNFYHDQILDSAGSSGMGYVDVHDWQSDVSHIWLYAPAITNTILVPFQFNSGNTWEISIVNETGASEGDYDAYIVAASTNSGSIYLYDKVEISISTGGIPYFPMDITPGGLNFCPKDVVIDGNYAYIAGSYNGLNIFDITDPSKPAWIHSVALPWRVHSIFVEDGYAYLGGLGIRIIDISTPENAFIVKEISLGGWSCEDVVVKDGYAYVAQLDEGLRILDVDPVSSAYLVSSCVTPGKAYGVDIGDGTMSGFAFVADETNGLHIIDVSIPDTPVLVQTVPTPGSDWGVEYYDGHAYVSDGNLQIIDVDPPATASIVKSVTVSGFTRRMIYDNGYLYAASYNYGLQIIDVDPILDASVVGSLDTEGYAYGVDVSGDNAYVASAAGGFYVINRNPPESPTLVTHLPTPGYAFGVTYSNGYAYIGNQNGGFQIVDVSPPQSAFMAQNLDLPDTEESRIDGSYAFVADNSRGLVIVDIDPPESATIINEIDTYRAEDVEIVGGYAFVADNTAGIKVIDIDPVSSASIVHEVATPASAIAVKAKGDYLYVANHSGGLQILNISDPLTSSIVHSVAMESYTWGLDIQGDYCYVSDHAYGMKIVDISVPESAFILKKVEIPMITYDVDVQGDYAYVASYGFGLYVVSINPPEDAQIFSELEFMRGGNKLDVNGKYAYVSGFEGGLRIIELW